MLHDKSKRREQSIGSFVVRLWSGQTGRFHDMPRAEAWALERLRGQEPGAYAEFYRAVVAAGRDDRGSPFTEPFSVLEVDAYGHITRGVLRGRPVEPLDRPYPHRARALRERSANEIDRYERPAAPPSRFVTPNVRDYVAVDPQDRTIAGPFKGYGEAKHEADRVRGHVKYVPSAREAGRRAPPEPPRHFVAPRAPRIVGAGDDLDALIAQFPAQFGLYGYPGDVFRISRQSSYIGSYGPQLYTQKLWPDGTWHDFAKGSPAELRREIVRIASAGSSAREARTRRAAGRNGKK